MVFPPSQCDKKSSRVRPRCAKWPCLRLRCDTTRKTALLLVVLDDFSRADMRIARVLPRLAKSSALTQQIPALIQFDNKFCELFAICIRRRPLRVQPMLFRRKALDMVEDRLVRCVILHNGVLRSACSQSSTAYSSAPPRARWRLYARRWMSSCAGPLLVCICFLENICLTIGCSSFFVLG